MTPSPPDVEVRDAGTRSLVVWVPDWPLVAAGVSADEPAAVFVSNRVVACTAAARAADVRRHMRRREAQARCPSLQVLDRDVERDAQDWKTQRDRGREGESQEKQRRSSRLARRLGRAAHDVVPRRRHRRHRLSHRAHRASTNE